MIESVVVRGPLPYRILIPFHFFLTSRQNFDVVDIVLYRGHEHEYNKTKNTATKGTNERNETKRTVSFCSDDQYIVLLPDRHGVQRPRGACLVTRIEAVLLPVEGSYRTRTCAGYDSLRYDVFDLLHY